MIFHENRLLADDTHEISFLISPYFFQKLAKMSKNLSSAAVIIGALMLKVKKKNNSNISSLPFLSLF